MRATEQEQTAGAGTYEAIAKFRRSTTTRRPFSGGDSLIRQLVFLPRATISSSADFRSRFLVSRILIMSTRRSRSPA